MTTKPEDIDRKLDYRGIDVVTNIYKVDYKAIKEMEMKQLLKDKYFRNYMIFIVLMCVVAALLIGVGK